MSDGQEKSDDLIAELAKLMANSASGPEPEAKPGPKLVSAPEEQAEQPRPVAPTIRIPGMDAPVAAAPQPTPAPLTPVTPAPAVAAPAPTFRIPGMDQPVAAASRPAAPVVASPVPAPSVAAASAESRFEPKFSEPRFSEPAATEPKAFEPKAFEPRPAEPRVPSIDFGTLPPAASMRPEPLSNWQDREVPKPAAVRPGLSADPVLTPPAPKAAIPAPAPIPVRVVAPVVAPPASAFNSAPAPVAAPTVAPAMLDQPRTGSYEDDVVVAGKPAPEGDAFDFDFGFGDNPPESVAEARPAVPVFPPASAPDALTGDPIADLIAAELDAGDDDQPAPPIPARPPVQAPELRSFPVQPQVQAPVTNQPQAQFQPQQQRPVTTNPVRPPVAPMPPPQPRAAEPDRFTSAPVFGVGNKPPAAAPVERDPMDEIESLIGEAVRVELSAPERPVVAERPKQPTAPVVPPLTTGFAPRRAAIKDTEPQIHSAEAAILAAAAASGADVDRYDADIAPEVAAAPYKRPKAKVEKTGILSGSILSGGMRQYVGMAVAGTLLLAAGFGLYWVLGMGRTADVDAPVLSADSTPAKEAAPVVAPREDAEGSVVFNSTNSGAGTPPADEQIVSRDASVDTSVADVAEPVGSDSAGATPAVGDGGESELANRKVRTVTVRPDGTIVSGDDAVAGNSALPVDRPNVPDIPGAEVSPSPLLEAVVAGETPTDPTQLALADPTAAGTAANINPAIVAPVPMARPTNRAALGGGSSQQVAATSSGPVDLTGNEVVAAPSAPAISSGGGAYVQLSSQPTTADAQSSLQTTQNRLSGILNGRNLEIRQVDLGARGVWYRVVLPAGSFSDATQICANFKANGTDCVAING